MDKEPKIDEMMISILESYLEFIQIVAFNCKTTNLPEQFKRQMNVLTTRRYNSWEPVLESLKGIKNGRTETTTKTSNRNK